MPSFLERGHGDLLALFGQVGPLRRPAVRLFTMGKDDLLSGAVDCGFNVLKRPVTISAAIYGNDEIACGNSYSSLWDTTGRTRT
jgi:hypothetical protein